jgi:hypothetical protein
VRITESQSKSLSPGQMPRADSVARGVAGELRRNPKCEQRGRRRRDVCRTEPRRSGSLPRLAWLATVDSSLAWRFKHVETFILHALQRIGTVRSAHIECPPRVERLAFITEILNFTLVILLGLIYTSSTPPKE